MTKARRSASLPTAAMRRCQVVTTAGWATAWLTDKVDNYGFGGGLARVCPVTGEVLFTAIHVDAPYVTVHVWNPREDSLRSIALDAPYSSYIHDFMITQDHAVVVVSPITMSQDRVLRVGGLM